MDTADVLTPPPPMLAKLLGFSAYQSQIKKYGDRVWRYRRVALVLSWRRREDCRLIPQELRPHSMRTLGA